MKLKIQIKNRFSGNVIFELEKDKNNIKETLLEAIKNGADLRDADLRYSILSGADLSGADLRGADLRDADLRDSILRDADLSGADLSGADLRYSNLQDADLSGQILRGADLSGADLSGADLSGAYLRDADFRYSILRDADLRGSDLSGAILRGYKIQTAAFFTGLYLYNVIPFITIEGEKRISMGCHNRSLEEWEANFWNNDNEFPNNGSLKSNLRLFAYKTAKNWFELIENKQYDN